MLWADSFCISYVRCTRHHLIFERMQMLIKKILEHALFLCKERGRDMFQHSHVIYKGSKNERTIDEVFIFYTTKKEKKRKKQPKGKQIGWNFFISCSPYSRCLASSRSPIHYVILNKKVFKKKVLKNLFLFFLNVSSLSLFAFCQLIFRIN